MSQKKRPKFKCYNCQRIYEITLTIEDEQPQLIITCPYCNSESVVDLAPWRPKSTLVAKGGKTETATEFFTLELPDVLPTQPKSA